MIKGKKILAVVPARGNSKGIPNKNLKLFNGKPLIGNILEKLVSIDEIDKVVVSSDSDEILNYSSLFREVKLIKRPEKLAIDSATLDPVILHVVGSLDENYDYVITFQPTSPLISKDSIVNGIKEFIDSKKNTLISCVDARHLMWTKKEDNFIPMYKNRVNRQQLDPIFKETGGMIGSKVDFFKQFKTRVDPKLIFLYELLEEEAIDIDSYNDWILCEEILKQEKVGFVVLGNRKKGLGHVYRCLAIANRLKQKPIFFLRKEEKLGFEKIDSSFYDVIQYVDDKDLFQKIKENNIKIIINDTLDTKKSYMRELAKLGFLVTFEDLGEGSDYANLSFNALYESSLNDKKHFFGYKYVDLRDEFLYAKKNDIKDVVKEVLIVFGGTDPNNMTSKVFNYLKDKYQYLNFTIVLGPGYLNSQELEQEVKDYSNFRILKSVKKMSDLISSSDIMISSNGRTVYEACSIGTPLLVVSQNEREIKHTFGEVSKTVINLGLFSSLTEEKFLKAFDKLKNDFELRKELNKRMLSYKLELGLDRIIDKIFLEFNNFKKN